SAAASLPPTLLLSPLAPPWVFIVAVAWILPGSFCFRSLLSSPWPLPPYGPPSFLLFSPWLLPLSSPPWTLFVVFLPGICPPSEPPLKFPPIPPSVVSTA
ncbi:hypothetical protein M9458_037090, partial [Cirrhinus mrigala]